MQPSPSMKRYGDAIDKDQGMAQQLSVEPLRPARVPPPSTPGPSGLGTLAVALVCIGALYVGKEVFIPLVLAVLLSFVLAPAVNLLRRWHLPRVPAIIVTVGLALGILLAVGGVIGLQIAELGGKLPEYQQTMEAKVARLQEGVFGRMSALIHKASTAVANSSEAPGGPPAPAAKSDPSAPRDKPVLVRLPQQEVSPLVVAQTVLAPIVSPLTTLGIVLVVVIFLLLQREDLRDRMIRLFGSSDLHRTTMAMDDAASRLSTYFLTQLGINASFGLIVGVGLWAIGVPSPILWGVFATLMRFVPYIGSAISALLPIALAAAVDPGWSIAGWTALLFLVTETLMSQVVEPLLYGHSTGLSPFAVIVSALFWAWLWGPIGLILSTPFTVILVVLGRHVEHLEFLDVLLGDRAALTPVENFYQRILAGDPDEARDHAERLLKDRSLIAYYDDVALKGLQLAANDVQRGVLGTEKLDTMKDSVKELVDELGEYDDRPTRGKGEPPEVAGAATGLSDMPTIAEQNLPAASGKAPARLDHDSLPPIWRGAGAIMCIAGRGPLDEAAAAILAQLLVKHGLGARVVPHEAVSRREVETLDLAGVAMVCIAYLEIKGAPSHLRYLLQRLRDRLDGQKLLVGLWPAGDAALSDETVSRQIGADVYVSSLRDAVEQCVAQARQEIGEKAAA